MVLNHVLMAVTGLSAGIVVSGGLFSFIVGLKVLPHIASVTATEKNIQLYESCVMWGGIAGIILWIFRPNLHAGRLITAFLGLSAGIFVGCWSMSILEILRGFPIFVRKTGLLTFMKWLILIIAAGKMLGSFMFFYFKW